MSKSGIVIAIDVFNLQKFNFYFHFIKNKIQISKKQNISQNKFDVICSCCG